MLDALYKPDGVAVIGASNNELSIGNRVVRNLISYGYRGRIYPVNPKGGEICGLTAYPSILDVPGRVDLVNIVIKNVLVPRTIADCGKKGVKFAIIHSSGFKEVGGEGIELERKVVETAREHGVRIYGPNCQGIINADEEISVYANFTFTPMRPSGKISIIAQSGGVGEVLNLHLEEIGVGIRMYASNGNASDVSINEILEYFGRDERTEVIMLYIESLKDPVDFMRIARGITKGKSILAMKSGKTLQGARAISSHTGALAAVDTTVDALFRKCGVVKFDAMDEMIDAAVALSTQPLPAGNRVAVVTNAGGPGIIAVDDCVDAGLILPPLSEGTTAHLKKCLNPESSVRNPVDITATAGPVHFGETVQMLLADDSLDSVLVNMITPFFVDCRAVALEIVKASQAANKPVVMVVMTNDNWAETVDTIRGSGIPVYAFPETAARVLKKMVDISALRRQLTIEREAGEFVFDRDKVEVEKLLGKAVVGEDGFIPQQTAFEVLRHYDIPVAESIRVACDGDMDANLSTAAAKLGYPLAVKIDARGVVHKTEEQAVILDVKDEEELLRECRLAGKRFAGREPAIILQPFLSGAKEVIMGVKGTPESGSLVMFGLGGIFVEVLKDICFRLAPVTLPEAEEMIRSIRGFPILKGVRGEGGVDIGVLSEILARLSALAADFPRIEEMDLNPLFAFEPGKPSLVVDVRLKMGR